mmetsp:Transcript_1806/g.5886  ORF Transcript_1806/g.5886 Transcript_1806/m.5886 type:complete len:214 (-) Transcript_1806:167-808(-)
MAERQHLNRRDDHAQVSRRAQLPVEPRPLLVAEDARAKRAHTRLLLVPLVPRRGRARGPPLGLAEAAHVEQQQLRHAASTVGRATVIQPRAVQTRPSAPHVRLGHGEEIEERALGVRAERVLGAAVVLPRVVVVEHADDGKRRLARQPKICVCAQLCPCLVERRATLPLRRVQAVAIDNVAREDEHVGARVDDRPPERLRKLSAGARAKCELR